MEQFNLTKELLEILRPNPNENSDRYFIILVNYLLFGVGGDGKSSHIEDKLCLKNEDLTKDYPTYLTTTYPTLSNQP